MIHVNFLTGFVLLLSIPILFGLGMLIGLIQDWNKPPDIVIPKSKNASEPPVIRSPARREP